jgi:hypothetical protein
MSTLKVNTLTDTAATKSVPIEDVVNGVARAWVNFNGTGTVAIRASYNVTDITDNGTGNYTVNFTTAMPDANYALSGSAYNSGGNNSVGLDTNRAPSSSAAPITTSNTNTGAAFDSAITTVAIFR